VTGCHQRARFIERERARLDLLVFVRMRVA